MSVAEKVADEPFLAEEEDDTDKGTGFPVPLPAPFPVGARVRSMKDGRVVRIVHTFRGQQGTGMKLWDESGPLGMNDVTVHGYSVWINEKFAADTVANDYLSGRRQIITAKAAHQWERIP